MNRRIVMGAATLALALLLGCKTTRSHLRSSPSATCKRPAA